MNNYNNPKEACSLVVDSGHSFTHIVPFIDGKIVRDGIIRYYKIKVKHNNFVVLFSLLHNFNIFKITKELRSFLL